MRPGGVSAVIAAAARRETPPVAGLAVCGLVAGIVAKIADEGGPGWAADLGTHPGVWALITAAIGTLAPSMATAALRSSGFFVAMCLGYYAWAGLVLGFPRADEAFGWLALAVSGVPVVAVAAWWGTRHRGLTPSVVMGGIAGLAFAGGSVWRVWLYAEGLLPGLALRPVQALLEVLMALAIALVLPRHTATRVGALAMLLPMVWLAPRAFDLAMRLLT